MGPSSFQWCPATGQGAMGTNWGTGSSVWTWGRTSSLWGWRSTGTGCPRRLWSLLLWRYSRPTWTRSSPTYCRWPCFGRGVGLDDPQRSLPTPNVLWFCNVNSSSVGLVYSPSMFSVMPINAAGVCRNISEGNQCFPARPGGILRIPQSCSPVSRNLTAILSPVQDTPCQKGSSIEVVYISQ